MTWLIGLLIVGFLIYAGGKETRFGGKDFPSKSAVGRTVFAIIVAGGVLLYSAYRDCKF